ncbi:MAG: rRNA pseudouridine synthase [Clostridia bacterium]|nr:rRNA pseudouridine synthase [Clostridia bacterium]
MAKREYVRLQKMLADCGVASRRKSEELIRAGSVKVNGVRAEIGDKVDPYNDKVMVNGRRVTASAKPKHRYIMLNKPRGYVTTMSDERGRKCVAELVADIPERVYPVGRLDKDSEGLLLFTNDGEFANIVMHPKKDIYKVYRVTVRPAVTDEMIAEFQNGMMLDGRKTAPAEVRVISRQEGRVVLEILLREGRNRQIRRMCEMLGLEVARLRRTAIGQVKMGMLKKGDWRDLTPEEVKKLTADPNPSRHLR